MVRSVISPVPGVPRELKIVPALCVCKQPLKHKRGRPVKNLEV